MVFAPIDPEEERETYPPPEQVAEDMKQFETTLRQLFKQITDWLPPGWTAGPGPHRTVFEAFQRLYGQPPSSLPTLWLYKNGEHLGKVNPVSRYTWPRKGEVDLWLPSGLVVLMDPDEPTDQFDWVCRRILTHGYKPFTRERLHQLIEGRE